MDTLLCDDVLRLIVHALGWGADVHALARVSKGFRDLAQTTCARHRALVEARAHVLTRRDGLVGHDGLAHAQTLWRRFAPEAWKAALVHHGVVRLAHGNRIYTFADLMEGRVRPCPTCRTVHAPAPVGRRGSGCPRCAEACAKRRAR